MGKKYVNKGAMGQSGRIRVPRPVLAVVAVLLLALGASALASAKGAATHGSGPLADQWWLFAAAAVGVGIVSIVKLRERISATEPDSSAQARLNRGVLAVVAVLTAAVPVTLYLMRPQASGVQDSCGSQCIQILTTGTPSATPQQQKPTTNANTHHTTFKLPLSLILAILGVMLLLVAAAAVALLILKLRELGKDQPGITGAPPPALAEEAQDESVLGAALLAGRNALEGEARAAIIACYAAMEDSLAEAGVPRLESDSPADLLRRATESGLVSGPAPLVLARLFREARFSTHPMNAAQLDQARHALDAITAQLTASAEAG
ncbi:DUF4129 domain-containing protein [Actinospica sp. MGRD01-02]|uniref:DUF4129 domain-containing protein n=1 Tax=Actinospica acidithermotolerans TaxID=2828514 RepID=A0A941E7D8_9ACTN|nr:DUF4129 domain-containing protein [Actinospica acidithermotolerans]MBR7826411.1 DUF4129 domain-containing protein [Actinospica acidithermotolerans]